MSQEGPSVAESVLVVGLALSPKTSTARRLTSVSLTVVLSRCGVAEVVALGALVESLEDDWVTRAGALAGSLGCDGVGPTTGAGA
jgi:hypothetical protein